MNANAVGREVAISFNDGPNVSTDILAAAIIGKDSQITIPGRVKFRLYRKTPVFVGADAEKKHTLPDDLKEAARAFMGNGHFSEAEIDAFKSGVAAALVATTTYFPAEADKIAEAVFSE